MFETNPVESMIYPGYYHTPICDWIVVHPSGKVIDLLSGNELVAGIPANKHTHYPIINIPSFRTVSVHRLLAITFIKCIGNPAEMQVNHKDGDKMNYQLSNLEWCTASENAMHAYTTGLRRDNRKVKIMNLLTGDIHEFHSVQAASRFFNENAGKLHLYLNNRDDMVPFNYKWELVYGDEEFRGLTKMDIGKIRNGRPKPVIVIEENKLTIYESAMHLANTMGVSGALVALWIKGKVNSSARGFTVMYLHEFNNSLDDAEYLVEDKSHYKPRVPPKRTPLKVEVTNNVTGVVENWESLELFANSLGVLKNTIQKSLLVKNGEWKYYSIKYLKT